MWFFLFALSAQAQDPEPAPEVDPEPAVQPAPAPEPGTTLVWQGFDHTWLRRALGAWSVPHRVSLFRSGPAEVTHRVEADGVQTEGVWEFAQSTGVDGDWMQPEGYAARLHSPGVQMVEGRTALSTVDQALGPGAPRALARFHRTIRVERRAPDPSHAVALVRGLAFRSACVNDPTQCNSDGIWPYRFRVELAPCTPEANVWLCPLTVEVGRAWTPNKGGVKGIEVKPLNERMAIEVELDWVVLEGARANLTSTTAFFENSLSSNRRIRADPQQVPIPVEGGNRYPRAAIGLSSFGFEFYPTRSRADDAQRGRYLAGWNLRVQEAAYDPEQGVFTVAHAGGLWLPRTVRSTGVSLELGFTIVQLGHEGAAVTELPVQVGRLCSDSHNAPFFSRWQQCADRSGSEQLTDKVPLVDAP